MPDPDPIARLNAALEGRYHVERPLGEGGMATVYLAQDLRHERKVALKVLHPDLVAADGGERFLREIRVTAGLHHPHILALLDSGEADGLLYYVMPLVEGESLRDRLKREGALPLEDALDIAAQVADALEAAHQAGVLHRDIKPANILLTGDHAIVADFGIAKGLADTQEEGLTRTGVSVGTPAYMSPEQGAGDSIVDARSDVYALGCVLYEMLAGSPPFAGASGMSLLARHALDPVPDIRTVRRSIPEDVRQVLLRSLEKVPADRYATAGAFRDAIRSPPKSAGSARKVRVRAVRRVAVVAGAAALGAGAVYASFRLLASGEDSTRTVLAWPLENRSGDSDLAGVGVAIAENVADEASQAGLARGLAATRVLSVVPSDAPWSPDLLRSGADDAGADFVVSGQYSIERDSVRVTARLSGPEPGDLRRTLSVVGPGAADPSELEDLVTSRVLGAIALETQPNLDLWADEAHGGRAPRWEALQAWQNAEDLLSRGQAEEQRAELRHALEIDPLFASPAMLLVFNGEDLFRAADLSQRRGDFGPRGLLRLDLMTAWGQGDWETVRRLGDRLAEDAPPNGRDWFWIGVTRSVTGRYQAALDAFEQIDLETLVFRGDFWRFKSDALHALGDFEAQRALGTEVTETLGAPAGVLATLSGAAAMGDTRAVDSLLASDARQRSGDLADNRRVAAQELAAHGFLDQAQELFDEAVQEFVASGESEDPRFAYAYAVALGYAGRWEQARDVFTQLYDSARPGPLSVVGCMDCDRSALLFHLAQAAAHLGNRQRALDLVEQLPDGRGSLLLRARVRAALGDRDVAVALLREASEKGRNMDPYDHITPDFASLRGYAPYESFMRPMD